MQLSYSSLELLGSLSFSLDLHSDIAVNSLSSVLTHDTDMMPMTKIRISEHIKYMRIYGYLHQLVFNIFCKRISVIFKYPGGFCTGMIYEPREDSFLLLKHVKEYASRTVLDMGTGSGILAEEAAKTAKKVFAVDINAEAVAECRNRNRVVTALESDLFSCFEIPGYPEYYQIKFDLIIFNPPYLPDHHMARDIALDGGKHGYEVTGRFLDSANRYLKPDGKILLLFSSLTKKDKVDEMISHNCLSYKQIDSLKLDFEELFVYLIEKSALLRELEKKGVSRVYYLAKGKRGMVYTGMWKNKKITVKTKNPASQALGRIKIEARMLEILNKESIGPNLQFSGDNFIAYEYVDGEMILDFISRTGKKDEIAGLFAEIFRQLHILDRIRISKEEMHHPVKHILVGKKPVLIDFERAHYTERPQNVTQFCQFVMEISGLLMKKGIFIDKKRIVDAAKAYRKDYDIRKVLEVLK